MHSKLEAYRRNNVKEYVVWRVLDRAIDWFVRVGDNFQRLDLNADGWYQSRVFPGLWLDPVALINGDLLKVFAVVQQGIGSKEHQDFVATLKAMEVDDSVFMTTGRDNIYTHALRAGVKIRVKSDEGGYRVWRVA